MHLNAKIDPCLPGKYFSPVLRKVLEHKNYFSCFSSNLAIKGKKMDSTFEYIEVDYTGIGFFSLRKIYVTSL